MKSSSIDNISTGDVELASSGGIERATTGFTSTNAQLEALPSKQRRDKMNNKAQQDEEEERGIHSFPMENIILLLSPSLEIIRVYDGNATFRNGNPRSISVPKQATYTQILVRRNHSSFLQRKIVSRSSRRLLFAHSISMMIARNIVSLFR